MKITFYKYHGAGNDFVAIDNRNHQNFTSETIRFLCDRKFGIGADGVLLIQNGTNNVDFHLDYYNSDGNIGSLCGNGSRCAVAFAHDLKIIQSKTLFSAFDGIHEGCYQNEEDVWVSMNDVNTFSFFEDGYSLDTGSPHFVTYVDDIQNVDVYNAGKNIRNDIRFPDGINVNFVSPYQDGIFVRTFERGVENETLSCGTGVTASAIIHSIHQSLIDGSYKIKVFSTGGDFIVSFLKQDTRFTQIILQGPTKFVFEGKIEI
jgi:diaminopimelate epimerase